MSITSSSPQILTAQSHHVHFTPVTAHHLLQAMFGWVGQLHGPSISTRMSSLGILTLTVTLAPMALKPSLTLLGQSLSMGARTNC